MAHAGSALVQEWLASVQLAILGVAALSTREEKRLITSRQLREISDLQKLIENVMNWQLGPIASVAVGGQDGLLVPRQLPCLQFKGYEDNCPGGTKLHI